MTLCIACDAGHGGDENPGNVHSPLIEKQTTLELGLSLKASLEHTPLMVELIRDKDVFVPNAARASLAAKVGADLALILHTNSLTDPTKHGGLLLYNDGDGPMAALASHIQSIYPPALRPCAVRPALKAQYPDAHWLLERYAAEKIPALLVEAAFASNPDDAAVLASPWGREEIVSALRAGVAHWVRAHG